MHEQARQYLAARPWEAIGSDTVSLRLKAGSWYEACAQPMLNGELNLLMLFPGRGDFSALLKAGMAEPPAGTVFAQLHGPEPRLQVITRDGWVAPDRLETRLMALAMAAITALATSTDPQSETAGDLTLPGGVRGRFIAKKTPGDDSYQMLVGIPSFDLYGEDDDATLTVLTLPWWEYDSLRDRSQHYQAVGERFTNRNDLVPVIVISGVSNPAIVAGKLRDADPRGLGFGEMDGVLAVMASGLKQTYVLTEMIEERESMMSWWYRVKAAGGAHALIVCDTTPDLQQDGWSPSKVAGVFEFGRQRET